MANYSDIKPRLGEQTAPAQQGDIILGGLPTRQEAKEAPEPTAAQTKAYDTMWGRGHELAGLRENVRPEVAAKWVQSDLADFRQLKGNERLTRDTLLYMHDWGVDCPPYEKALNQAAPRLAQSVKDMKAQDKVEKAAAAGQKAGGAKLGANLP